MLTRHALLVLAAGLIPAVANAWTITASSNSGGTISPKGSISVSGTTGTSKSFEVKPSTGYRVSQVTIDNVSQPLPAPDGNGVYPYSVSYNGVFNRNIFAAFVVQTYKLTSTAEYAQGANGWVVCTTTPAGLPLAKLPPNTPVQCTATSAESSVIDYVRLNGVPQTVTNPGQLAMNLVINQDTSVAARFKVMPRVTVSAGPNLIADGNGQAWPVTLNGSASTNTNTPLTYGWSATNGPAGGVGVFGSPNAAVSSFYAISPGSYTVKLTATDGVGTTNSATAVVTIPWRSATLADYCISCHVSRDPVIVGQYTGSKHRSTGPDNTASCQACHNNPGEEYKHYAFSRPTGSCQPCHSSATPQVVTDYLASAHPAQGVGCTSCHYDHSLPKSYSVCLGCHKTGGVAPQPPVAYHPASIISDLASCNGCHNPHLGAGAPANHFNNITTGSYPAQYVTRNVGCSNCHTVFTTDMTVPNKVARNQWAKTGKGDVNSPAWTQDDFKTMGTAGASPATSFAAQDCVRCHTTTGYINYVTDAVGDGFSAFRDIAAWGVSSDKTKEVLACNTCHVSTADPAQTFDGTNSRRVVGNYLVGVNAQAWYSYSSAGGKNRIAKTFNDEGESNLCIPCHSGRTAGNNIRKLPAGFNWSNVDFINPHNMAAAGVMFPGFGTLPAERQMTIGYEFTGRSYGNSGTHAGLDQSDGPCIQCHMTYSPDKHRFGAVSTASNGVIRGITSSRCADCHNTGATIVLDSGAKLEAKRQRYLAALAVVEALFTPKGIHFKGDKSPYFFTDATYATNVTNWVNADTMGAAFNLKLLQSEKGAYVHNALHVQQLFYDTVDFLDDGTLNSSVATTIQNLALDPAVKGPAQEYLGTRWLAVPSSP